MLCERLAEQVLILDFKLQSAPSYSFYILLECKSCMTQAQVVIDVTYYIIPLRMDQACGVHTWLRQHPPVSQPAPGDL